MWFFYDRLFWCQINCSRDSIVNCKMGVAFYTFLPSWYNIFNSTKINFRTRDATYDYKDGSVHMHLRGKPVTLYAPTELKNSYSLYETNPTSPDKSLKLEWVYGYRGKDARSNLYLLPTGELVYFMASVVVLFNPDLNKQRHYMGHTEEVKWWVNCQILKLYYCAAIFFCASSLKLKGDYHRKTYNNEGEIQSLFLLLYFLPYICLTSS